MLAVLVVTAALATQPISYVRNGRCESLTGWELPRGQARLVARDGGRCILVTGGMGQQRIWRRPGWKRMTVAVDIRAEEVIQDQPGGFAFAAVYQYDENETLLAFRDFVQLRQPADWKRYTYTFDVLPETATVNLHFGFYRAHGKAYFDNWTLVEGAEAADIDQVREVATGRGSRRVVIWREPSLELPPGGLSPTWAASVLRSAGMEVTLADRATLQEAMTQAAGSLLVLPYGDAYPVELRGAIIDFCRNAGKLLIVGGYPFNKPLGPRGEDWAAELKRRRQQAQQWPNNMLADGGFEKSADAPVGGKALDGRWRRNAADACHIVADRPVEGRRCALVEVREGADHEAMWYTYLPLGPGHEYVLRAWARAKSVSGPGYAYVAVYQYRGDKLIKPYDVVHLSGDTDWRQVEYHFRTELGADQVLIKVGLYRATGRAWFDKVQLVDLTPLRYRPLNTSSAPPGDGLHLAPWQMGMCDAHFPLKRVAYLQPADEQSLITRPRTRADAKGWACVGVVGYANARWVPLLDARDRYGRLRGAAGALMLNYGGFYQGSLWAYFAVTDRRLFDPGVPGSDEELIRVADFLLRGIFLHSAHTDFDLYSPGERCQVRFSVANYGPEPFRGTATVALIGQRDYARTTAPVAAPPGRSTELSVELTVPKCREDLLRIVVRLDDIRGRRIDRLSRGIVVRHRQLASRAPLLDFRDNYFRLGGRPIFLFGSDNYLNDYKSEALNPGRWDQIHAKARDFGVQVYENLQYNNPGHVMTEADWRSFEAMGQLLQKRGLVFMCGLLIGHNVAVGDEELAAESRVCEQYARRLGFLPALLWYINGDYQLRYDNRQWLKQAWNEWLKARYGTDAALKKAWGGHDLRPLGQLPFPPKRTGRWDDPVEQDRIRFNAWLMRRWNQAHVAAIRRSDHRHKITSEYYSEPWNGIDQRLTIDGQDVADFGFFSTPEDDLDVLPERLAINDLRAIGKGVTIGEYGCKTHPAWTVENGARGYHIVRTEEQQKQLFMAVAAYALGMGASKIQNWCLRDADERVFPWGIFYPGRNVPKDVAYVHRNLSMMWRLLEPRYDPPEVTVLAPTPLRIGHLDVAGRRAVYGAAQGLLRLHIPFNVLDDFDATDVPRATKTVVWPAAIAADEQVFSAVLRWVRGGGQLIISGYPGWDENRREIGDRRLRALIGCGVRERLFSGVARSLAAERSVTAAAAALAARPQVRLAGAPRGHVVVKTADGLALVVSAALGRGHVVWIADPAELGGRKDYALVTALYRAALGALPTPPGRIDVVPDDPDVHVMRQRTRTGWVWVVFPTARAGPKGYVLTLATPAGLLALRARRRWPALVAVSADGRLLMALTDGELAVGGRRVVGGDALVGVVSLDGQDLRCSSAALVLPFSTGTVRLPTLSGAIELGEWRDGRWRQLEDLSDRAGQRRQYTDAAQAPADARDGKGITVRFDDDRATAVALVADRAERPRWHRFLADLCTRPWTLRGY